MSKTFTDAEQKVADSLVAAWHAFNELPVQHPDDCSEFRHGIHRLQHLMGVRALRRDYPEEWYSEPDTVGEG